jgi:hypothetical protein
MKRDRYERLLREQEEEERRVLSLDRLLDFAQARRYAPVREMGLAPGGRLEQAIYADPYGIDAWDQSAPSRCFVSLLNAEQWRDITGDLPPTRPPTAADYANAGLPWFQHYGADLEALGGAQALALAKSVAEMAAEKGDQVLGSDGTVSPAKVIVLGPTRARSANQT